MSEVVSDLFSLENFARSGAAAAFAYAAAPVVFQGPAVFSFSAVPGLSGVQVDKSTGLAVIAFLTATAIDLIQSRILRSMIIIWMLIMIYPTFCLLQRPMFYRQYQHPCRTEWK